MAFYTYDEEADALYVSLVPDDALAIARTIELSETLHVDVDQDGKPIGVEILYPSTSPIDLDPLRKRFALDLKLPFHFAA